VNSIFKGIGVCPECRQMISYSGSDKYSGSHITVRLFKIISIFKNTEKSKISLEITPT
jgi:hypothetical protein